MKGQKIDFIEMIQVSREHLKAYAEASGDHNLIHLDDAVAKKMGLPGVIAHGMLISGVIAERARRWQESVPQLSAWKLVRYQNRFKAMTFPGDAVSVGGEVRDVSDREWVVELVAKNQKGEITTTGTFWYGQA